jgi:hypothetical protein
MMNGIEVIDWFLSLLTLSKRPERITGGLKLILGAIPLKTRSMNKQDM